MDTDRVHPGLPGTVPVPASLLLRRPAPDRDAQRQRADTLRERPMMASRTGRG